MLQISCNSFIYAAANGEKIRRTDKTDQSPIQMRLSVANLKLSLERKFGDYAENFKNKQEAIMRVRREYLKRYCMAP